MKDIFKYLATFVAGVSTGVIAVKLYDKYKNKEVEYEELVPAETEDGQNEIVEKNEVEPVRNEFTPKDRREYEEYASLYKSAKKAADDYNEKAAHCRDNEKYFDEVTEDDIDRSIPGYTPEPDSNEPRNTDIPYPIREEDFLAIDDYDSDDYTMYNDGYVTDSAGFPVSEDEVNNLFGKDYRRHFGLHDPNQIWLRNERLRMDFSIARDLDDYAVVAPPRMKRLLGIE